MSKGSARAEAAKQTQASILAASVELFATQGYKATSIEQIAAAAGVAKGTIYIYYKSKRVLFRAVCEVTVADFVAGIDELLAQDWVEQLDCLEAVLLHKFLYFHEILMRSPNAAALLQKGRDIGEEIFARGDELFAARVLEATKRAESANEVDVKRYDETVDGLASLLIAACHGIDLTLPPPAYRRDLRRLIAAIFRGYSP